MSVTPPNPWMRGHNPRPAQPSTGKTGTFASPSRVTVKNGIVTDIVEGAPGPGGGGGGGGGGISPAGNSQWFQDEFTQVGTGPYKLSQLPDGNMMLTYGDSVLFPRLGFIYYGLVGQLLSFTAAAQITNYATITVAYTFTP